MMDAYMDNGGLKKSKIKLNVSNKKIMLLCDSLMSVLSYEFIK